MYATQSGRSQNRNVTMLDDLPELEDLESRNYSGMNADFGKEAKYATIYQQGQHPEGEPAKYQKFLRSNHQPLRDAGMDNFPKEHYQSPQQPMHDAIAPPRPMNDTPNCLDFNSHVSGCPICSRFYNNDNSIYIIAIIVLSIICILLLKKVLNL